MLEEISRGGQQGGAAALGGAAAQQGGGQHSAAHIMRPSLGVHAFACLLLMLVLAVGLHALLQQGIIASGMRAELLAYLSQTGIW